jgi:hypothetical protein
MENAGHVMALCEHIINYIGIYCRWVKIVKVIYPHHITTPHIYTLYGY